MGKVKISSSKIKASLAVNVFHWINVVPPSNEIDMTIGTEDWLSNISFTGLNKSVPIKTDEPVIVAINSVAGSINELFQMFDMNFTRFFLQAVFLL